MLQVLFLGVASQYSVSFSRAKDSLVYTYPSPYDYTFAKLQFKLDLDEKFKNKVWVNSETELIFIESERDKTDTMFDLVIVKSTDSFQGNIMTVSLHTGLSNPGAQADGAFCLTTQGADLDHREIIWEKSNTTFDLAIDGLDSFYCTSQILNPFEERKTMFMSKVTVSNIKGCFSTLALPGVDLLDLDTICNPGFTLTEGVQFHMGEDCTGDIVECPTEPVPVVTTEGDVIVTKKVAETTEPQSADLVVTEAKVEPDTPEVEEEEKEQDTEEEEEKEEGQDTEEKEEEDEGNNSVEQDYTVDDVIDPGKEEAATDNRDKENRNIITIVIVVVISAIIIVIILLYVGYRFHFRDKGSYKLEETKEGPPADEFGGQDEFSELTPNANGKDQEWYL